MYPVWNTSGCSHRQSRQSRMQDNKRIQENNGSQEIPKLLFCGRGRVMSPKKSYSTVFAKAIKGLFILDSQEGNSDGALMWDNALAHCKGLSLILV